MTMNGARMVRGAPEGFWMRAGHQAGNDQKNQGGMYELSLAYAENDNDKWYWGGTREYPL